MHDLKTDSSFLISKLGRVKVSFLFSTHQNGTFWWGPYSLFQRRYWFNLSFDHPWRKMILYDVMSLMTVTPPLHSFHWFLFISLSLSLFHWIQFDPHQRNLGNHYKTIYLRQYRPFLRIKISLSLPRLKENQNALLSGMKELQSNQMWLNLPLSFDDS